MNFWLQGMLVFVVGVIYDFAYAIYNRRTVQGNALGAANWSTLIGFLAAFSVLNYTRTPSMVVFLMAGYWCGTYLGVKIDTRRKLDA